MKGEVGLTTEGTESTKGGAESAASAVVFLSACVWLGFWESHEYVGRRGSLTKAQRGEEEDGA